MKLFINNKEKFDNEFPNNDGNSNSISGQDVHRAAFKYLISCVGNNNIPLDISIEFDDQYILFQFEKKLDDIFFYKYIGIV